MEGSQSNIKLILAGPGTGKTTRVKEIVSDVYKSAKNIQVISFTRATVNDLNESFSDDKRIRCNTLHSYALYINHLSDHYVLDEKKEIPSIKQHSEIIDIPFLDVCSQLKCITFDEMISSCVNFLKTNQAYATDKIGRLDLLIVDEFQDFNENERDLIFLLSEYSTDVIILGDDDQSIYDFKDADPQGIIDLYHRADIEHLDHKNYCYRCPDIIVDIGLGLISKNRIRIDKPWKKTTKEGEIFQKQFLTQEEVFNYILTESQKHDFEREPISIMVLSPVRYYLEILVSLLESEGLPYVDFWTHGLSDDDYEKIWWIRAIFSDRKIVNLSFLSRTLSQHFKKKFRERLLNALREGEDDISFAKDVARMFKTPLAAYLESPPTLSDFRAAHTDFEEFCIKLDEGDLNLSSDELLKDFLPPTEFDPNSINIMSIHKSKGLQADIVFITGLVEGILPDDSKGLDTLEYQRRLLFVAITRAEQQLHLLSPVLWEGTYVHKVGKDQFKYAYKHEKWTARTSRFLPDLSQ